MTTKHMMIAALSFITILTSCSDRSHKRNSQDEEFQSSQSTNIDIPLVPHQQKFGFPDNQPGPVSGAVSSETVLPGIPSRSAPGVAFTYRYAFVLPDDSIAAVQETHARACESLSPYRCRVVGMRYTRHEDNEVTGMLQFKLSPELARGFGKDGISAVEQAKGKLVDAAIEGREVAAQIATSERRSGELRSELSRIEGNLASKGSDEAERSRWSARASQLRQAIAQEGDERKDGAALLANTPMTYLYAGTEGFTPGDHPIQAATNSFQVSLSTMISVMLTCLGAILPWLLPLGLIFLVTRFVRRRWWFVRSDETLAHDTAKEET